MNVKIFYNIGWNSDKNIGTAYNQLMDRLKPDDWACFIDRDAMFVTNNFGNQIEDIINKNPTVSFFTCMTNRVDCKWQLAKVDKESDDMNYHVTEGYKIQKQFYYSCRDVTEKALMSGVVMLCKKSGWEKIGPVRLKGMLGVDNDIHKRLRNNGFRLYLMQGIYVYHWYRNNKKQGHQHLL